MRAWLNWRRHEEVGRRRNRNRDDKVEGTVTLVDRGLPPHT